MKYEELLPTPLSMKKTAPVWLYRAGRYVGWRTARCGVLLLLQLLFLSCLAQPAFADTGGSASTTTPTYALEYYRAQDHGDSPVYLRVLTDGVAPTADTAVTLVDEQGHNLATVTVVDPTKTPAAMAGELRYASPAGTSVWYLKIAGPGPGSKVVGTVPGASTDLKLTLGVRHIWWHLPLVVLVVAILIGALASYLVETRVPDYIQAGLLKQELGKLDEKKPPDRDEMIVGLGAWIKKRKRRYPLATLRQIVSTLSEVGLEQDTEAKVRLQKALDVSPLKGGEDRHEHPLHKQASEVAAAPPKITDFYNGDKEAESLPAVDELALLKRAEDVHASLDRADKQIKEMGDPADLRKPYGVAKSQFDEAKSESELSQAELRVNELWKMILEGLSPDGRTALLEAHGAQVSPLPSPGITPSKVDYGLVRLPPSAGPVVAGVLVIAALVAGAATAILFSKYEPNPTFGTLVDYANLVIAGMAAGVIAGILKVLALWKMPQKT